ncbi:MAG: holo-ACP synthase [Planctomycetota bacterium]
MIVAIGVDTAPVARFEGLLARASERTYARLCTSHEAAYCRSRAHPAEALAARFAAKEAVLKCLGTGWASGLGFAQIEVTRATSGAVSLQLHGAAAERARALGIDRWHVSLTHTEALATAFVVAERTGSARP